MTAAELKVQAVARLVSLLTNAGVPLHDLSVKVPGKRPLRLGRKPRKKARTK